MRSIEKKVIGVVARTLDVPESSLSSGTKSTDIPQWDSLGHLRICMALEETFGIKVGLEEMEQMQTVDAIIRKLSI